ncbi:hypothetical protein TNCV_809331 [Trichonephila clavipes]|uniref:RNA-directed DNA polymerase from mobile element jockey n=1 Tax=Trichonephila clavipes TaxID=2585209 RepID=A0A8X6SBV3_TRICX|nr:hypothetical protein TNCV_809331 [Trichonephila clavipes]
MRSILAYASPVWGYAAKANINILDTLQNSLIRIIIKATRYMRNDDIQLSRLAELKPNHTLTTMELNNDLPMDMDIQNATLLKSGNSSSERPTRTNLL